MKIRIQILLVFLAFIAIVNSTRAANIIWTNTAGGNWSATTNWNPNQLPGASDIAVITNDGSYTVTLDVDTTINGLVLGTTNSSNIQTLFVNNDQSFVLNGNVVVSSNGQFNLSGGGVLSGNAVLYGTMSCAGGTLSGTLLVPSNSVLNISAPGVTFNGYPANVGVVTNFGTVNWNGGTLSGDNNPLIVNNGLWIAQTDGTFVGTQSSGDSVFRNFGI